jgi:hypothetical protein
MRKQLFGRPKKILRSRQEKNIKMRNWETKYEGSKLELALACSKEYPRSALIKSQFNSGFNKSKNFLRQMNK